MSVACVSPQQGKTTVSVEDVLGFVGDKLAAVSQAVQATDAKLVTVSAELATAKATVASMEEIVGPVDTDKDGEISAAEAAEFYGKVTTSTDPKAQDPATQSEAYKALMALMAAQFASRKLGHKLPPSLQWITAILGSPTKKDGAAT